MVHISDRLVPMGMLSLTADQTAVILTMKHYRPLLPIETIEASAVTRAFYPSYSCVLIIKDSISFKAK